MIDSGQYALFKGVRPNSRNFKPFDPGRQSFEAWAALNDVNILSLTDKNVIFEYAFVVDGRKKWAKLSGSFRNSSPEMVKNSVAQSVEAIRNEIDEAEA